jgi:hypothetical protein
MCLLKSLRVALGGIAFSAVLAGCGSSSPQPVPVTPGSSVDFNDSATTVHSRQKSWMLPAARQQQSLLYISNVGSASVTVYTYLNGGGLVLVGTLTGFVSPSGMCTDNTGDVWILDYVSGEIYEYQHGATSPIVVMKHQSGRPYDCAVDPTTGSLAVAEQHPNGHYRDYSVVFVYPKGAKSGRAFAPSDGFHEVYFVAYDNMSNLYADGTPCLSYCEYGGGGPPGLYELAKGEFEFSQLTISGATLNTPSAINWIKPTLLLGDQNFQGQGTNGAYKLLVSGSTATVVGTLPFKGTQQANGFWRRAGRVIVPDYTGNIVRIYNLSDGALISTLTTEISAPFGAVVSQ